MIHDDSGAQLKTTNLLLCVCDMFILALKFVGKQSFAVDWKIWIFFFMPSAGNYYLIPPPKIELYLVPMDCIFQHLSSSGSLISRSLLWKQGQKMLYPEKHAVDLK